MTLKLTQIRRIARQYAAELPGWRLLGDDLVRCAFPFVQGICFDRSSADDYRPTCLLVVLVVPLPVPLPFGYYQDLRAKNGALMGAVSTRAHDSCFREVVDAMKRQFMPPIDRPLSAEACLEYCERNAVPTVPETVDLAALHAFSADTAAAKRWVQRFHAEVARRPGNHDARCAYIADLVRHMDEGDARAWLTSIADENRRRLGLDG